jgi:hypothetical protein
VVKHIDRKPRYIGFLPLVVRILLEHLIRLI